ncbi:unnamed protein product [Camellia sinensis]
MKSILDSLLTIIFLLTIFLISLNHCQCSITIFRKDLITKVCKKTPNYKLCKSTLKSGDRISQTAIKGLCVIATNASMTKSKRFLSNMNILYKKYPEFQSFLIECKKRIRTIGWELIPNALQALENNDTSKAAQETMSKAVIGADECINSVKIKRPIVIPEDPWKKLKDDANSVYNLFAVNSSCLLRAANVGSPPVSSPPSPPPPPPQAAVEAEHDKDDEEEVVEKVEWALKLKGVEYEYIEEDVFNKSHLLLELNPVHKKVPVLIHGQKVILESFVILEYIDETWKQCPLLPQDPYQRAIIRFWTKFAEEKIWMAMCSEGDEKERALKASIEAIEKIETELKGKTQFFGGESIGYLDLALGWISYWLPVWEEVGSMKIVDQIQFPNTTAWMNNFVNHPVIKNKLPPRDRMIVDFQKRRKEIASLIAARKG